ncbi:MAG TPA: prolipoprotein diacylglyceryl transferase [Solirubrobacteraceae bacterium]|nr:prolipoprotein diacylglyceryl transferase [Solirubrobacteraceae bacterium]
MTTFAFIPSPPGNGFHIGPFFIHMYGIMYVLAVAAAIAITRHEWELRGGSREDVYEAAWWGFPAGLVGGRIYFLVTTPSQIPPGTFGFLEVWKGGLGIWGGVALGSAVGIWRIRRRHDWPTVREMLSVVAPALLVAQAIGRVGNYFNQELFGKPSTLPWALKIDPQFRPPGFAHFATFQPSFLYEMIWDLSLAAFLLWLGRKRVVRAPGLFALYVAGYSAYRIFEETIRIDYSEYILGERLNFWIALIVSLAGFVWFAWIQWLGPRARRDRAAGLPADPTLSERQVVAR